MRLLVRGLSLEYVPLAGNVLLVVVLAVVGGVVHIAAKLAEVSAAQAGAAAVDAKSTDAHDIRSIAVDLRSINQGRVLGWSSNDEGAEGGKAVNEGCEMHCVEVGGLRLVKIEVFFSKMLRECVWNGVAVKLEDAVLMSCRVVVSAVYIDVQTEERNCFYLWLVQKNVL